MSDLSNERIIEFVNASAKRRWTSDLDECKNLILYPDYRRILDAYMLKNLNDTERKCVLKYFFPEFEIGENIEVKYDGEILKHKAERAAKRVDFIFLFTLLTTEPGHEYERFEELLKTICRTTLKECAEDLAEAYYLSDYFMHTDDYTDLLLVLTQTVQTTLSMLQEKFDFS
ncbi:hypothetical protein IJG10_00780 [Candidatus Saccharibacteria bacterium]|nr:hypothetical protein [Candidatus Saccharibacteria bacterium]